MIASVSISIEIHQTNKNYLVFIQNMCLSVPGKIIEIKENGDCTVDYVAEKRNARIMTEDIRLGDYVIVSNKIVVMKVPKEQAEDYLNAIKKRNEFRR